MESPTEAALRRQVERAVKQQETLLRLASASELVWGEQLRLVLRADATTLDVQRVSYWSLDAAGQAIQCEALFRTGADVFESGTVLSAGSFPRYFAALHKGTAILATDAHTDPRTSEFSEVYLRPNGIGAMMDVPVYVRGKLTGVVCHEHVGNAREWSIDEQQFAMSIGQTLSLAIESAHRRQVEEALRESEARFRFIAQVSPVPLLVYSVPEGRCLWVNDAASSLSGIDATRLIGQPVPDWYADATAGDALRVELAENGSVEAREVQLRRADGRTLWTMVSIRPITLDGRAAVIWGIVDLTEQKRMEEVLRHAALHDVLTGLPNRRMLFDALRREIARASRDAQYRFAVLYLDLDGFKAVNDTLGHDVGDRLLVAVADQLRGSVRPMDLAARVGGDEFAILIARATSPSEAQLIADRVEAAIARPLLSESPEVTIRASIGIALCDATCTEPDVLLRGADQAMYAVKQAHRASRPDG